jgi:hypothetical protein
VSQFRWIAKDGRVVWVEARSQVITDSDGRPTGMRGVTMDFSQHKATEQERDGLLAEARELNRVKDQFLTTLHTSSERRSTPCSDGHRCCALRSCKAIAPARWLQELTVTS